MSTLVKVIASWVTTNIRELKQFIDGARQPSNAAELEEIIRDEYGSLEASKLGGTSTITLGNR